MCIQQGLGIGRRASAGTRPSERALERAAGFWHVRCCRLGCWRRRNRLRELVSETLIGGWRSAAHERSTAAGTSPAPLRREERDARGGADFGGVKAVS